MRRLLILLPLVFLALPVRFADAQTSPRCFPQTGYCIDGRFREYWEQNGGLPVFGYPVMTAMNEVSRDDGQTYLTLWLERNRFELHSQNARPYDVLLGRLGDDRLRQLGRSWQAFPKAAPTAAHFFAETGHAIAHPAFWTYWSTHGLEFDGRAGKSFSESLALFGMPLSEPQMETNASGDTVLTQWFERARFEDHGANGVLLGLLGNETRTGASIPNVPPAPGPGPGPSSPTGVAVVDQGFRVRGSSVTFGFLVRNPNTNLIAVGTRCQITYRDGAGAAVGLAPDEFVEVLYPGEAVGVVGGGALPRGGVGGIGIACTPRELVAPTAGGNAILGRTANPISVEQTTTVDRGYLVLIRAQIRNSLPLYVTQVKVTTVVYDRSGVIIGGYQEYKDFIPAGGTVTTRWRVNTPVAEYSKVETYAHFTILSEVGQ